MDIDEILDDVLKTCSTESANYLYNQVDVTENNLSTSDIVDELLENGWKIDTEARKHDDLKPFLDAFEKYRKDIFNNSLNMLESEFENGDEYQQIYMESDRREKLKWENDEADINDRWYLEKLFFDEVRKNSEKYFKGGIFYDDGEQDELFELYRNLIETAEIKY